jgi:hypothetical protein
MLSVNPLLTPAEIRAILRETADKIDQPNANYDQSGWSTQYGFGRINAAAAVRRARLVTAQGDDMQPGEVLNPDQSITSANGRYRFIYQGDGNLVLYDGGTPLWASGTDGRPVGVCIMQGDGNLVIYARGGQPIWSSDTWQHPGSRLVVQDDGNVVIYRPDGTPVWATNTVQP